MTAMWRRCRSGGACTKSVVAYPSCSGLPVIRSGTITAALHLLQNLLAEVLYILVMMCLV